MNALRSRHLERVAGLERCERGPSAVHRPSGRGRPRRGASVLVFLLATSSAVVTWAIADPPPDPLNSRLLDGFQELSSVMEDADWAREQTLIKRAIDNLWRRNKWYDEADRFARDLASETASIPPWRPLRRLEFLNDRIAKRYGLTGEKSQWLKGVFAAEAGRFLMRHSGVILDQTREVLQTRADGVPFTADQVARWAREGRPLLDDMRLTVERVSEQLKPVLDERGRRLLERDLKSFERRKAYVESMTERWSRGEWVPADYGMEDDPVQSGALSRGKAQDNRSVRVRAGGEGDAATTRLPQCVSYDPKTWFVCVDVFGKRFELDDAQKAAAQSIHDEMFERAKSYMEVHASSLQGIPERQRDTSPAYDSVRSMYDRMVGRLDAIPTSSQRERAK